MQEILLAVAVHDDHQARLESSHIEKLRVSRGETRTFRVSYRMADHSDRRESAHLRVGFRLDAGAWHYKEASMKDRMLLSDDKQGDLRFDVGPLEEGEHVLEFEVAFDTSDAGLAPGAPATKAEAHLAEAIAVTVD